MVTVLVMLFVAPSAALACDNWTNKSGGSWNNAANWSEGLPTSSSDVCITKGGTYEVTLEPTSSYVQVKSLKVGTSSGAQTLKVVGSASGGRLYGTEEVSITASATVVLTSSGSHESGLEAQAGSKLKNAGTIAAEAGGGGARWLGGVVSNTGAVTVAEGVSLVATGSSSFTNGVGGSVVGTGSGHVLVGSSATFVQGAGTTEGPEPVVLEGGTIEYSGSGPGLVLARGYSSHLKGKLAGGQTLRIEAECASGYAYVTVEGAVSNAGTIAMTSSGCANDTYLEMPSKSSLTNTGTVSVQNGAGGQRRIRGEVVNNHVFEVGAKAAGLLESGSFSNAGAVNLAGEGVLSMTSASFTNGVGGSVVGTGSGHVLVGSGSTFVQGAGTTEGPEPVVVENGTIEYSGSGAGLVLARGYSSHLKGKLAGGQTLRIEAECASGYAYVTVEGAVSNAGTIAMTSSGCANDTYLEMPSKSSLTNTGTVSVQNGAGGQRRIRGEVVNNHVFEVGAKAAGLLESGSFSNAGAVNLAGEGVLSMTSASFTNGVAGSVVGTGSGHLLVGGSATFVQGAGTTEGPEPVVLEGGTIEYTGGGASHVIARSYYDYLKGALVSGQTFTVEGNCTTHEAIVYTQGDVSSGGTIELESAGCERYAYLRVESGHTLTSTGTIAGTAGGGGGELRLEGTVVSEGAVEDLSGAVLSEYGSLTNGANGTVKGIGSGHLAVHGVFVQGAGTTSGPEPVVLEGAGTAEYTGGGASHVIARSYYDYLKGALVSGQTFTVEGNCTTHEAIVYTQGDVSSGGTIELESAGCERYAYLRVESGHTLTSTGTIAGTAGGGGGELRLEGTVVSEGAVEDLSGAVLSEYGSLTNGANGTVKGIGSGHLAVHGVFVQGAGTTSGPEPVVLEGAGTAEYTGGGASHVIARSYYDYLKGALVSGQTFTVEGNCTNHEAIVYTQGDVSSGGTIELESAGCERYAYLRVESGHTLTNAGTIRAKAAGGGGELRMEGTVVNSGTVAIDAGETLHGSGSFTQHKTGRLRTLIASKSSFGSLAVSGTATLAGTLEIVPVGGFKASLGDKFPFLTATTRVGSFEFEKGGQIGGALYYRPLYATEGVTLEASEAPPEGLPVNSAVPRIFGVARQGRTLVLSHGTWSHSPFEYADHWLRCNGSGGACTPIPGAHGDSYVLGHEDVGKRIRVEETATDVEGEGLAAQSAATEAVTELELKADAGENVTAYVGQPVALDGSASTPASEIAAYRWEFGDGELAEGASGIAHHAYAKATPQGEPLSAHLTVRNEANETSAPATTHVTVLPAPSAAEALTVTVEDSAENPLDEAEVVFVAGDGSRTQAITDSSGHALLAGLPAGTDSVYAYSPCRTVGAEHVCYQPAAAHAEVDAKHHGAVTVKLASGNIATTALKSHEMTLAEIEAAGIDPSDPANQNVYDFELRLAFIHSPLPPVEMHGSINSEGQFVGSYGASGGGEEGGGGGYIWTCSSTQCEGTPSPGGSPGEYHIIARPVMVDNHPLIQWLILKGKATVLKQFFEVSMVIQNLSPEPFKLTAGHATLNIPDGMGLAPTPVPQSARQAVEAIPGEGTATSSWIIRGDEEGEYQLSADYEAALEPFDAPFSSEAALEKPLRVWGKDALALKVDGDEEGLKEGRPWHFALGIEDKADVPLYNVELEIEEEPHANFDFQPRQQFMEMLGELTPGQTKFMKNPFVVVPNADSEAEFNAPLSSATFVGEEIHPGEGIKAVKRLLPIYEDLTAPQDTPGYVHLHWNAVPGAEGYEVYSTPSLTTAFANTPDHVSSAPGGASVTELGPGATDAYATGPGSRWYAVTAIIEGQRQLELETVQATAAEGEGEGPPGAPEIGRCVKAEGGPGTYSSSKCTIAGGKNAYSWLPGTEKHGLATQLASGAVTLESVAGVKIVCSGESGKGEFAGAKHLRSLTLKLTGCTEGAQPCASSGAAPGEIVTSALSGLLGIEKLGATHAKDKAALALYPYLHTGALAAFQCGSSSIVLRGSVLAPAKANKPGPSQTLKFKASKGVQKLQGFAGGGGGEVLEESVDGGEYKQAGLSANITATAEELFELNTVL